MAPVKGGKILVDLMYTVDAVRNPNRTEKGIRRVALVVALLAMVAVVASGCGAPPPAEEEWAADVCTAITAWRLEIRDEVLRPLERVHPAPGAGTKEAVLRTIADVRRLTRELAAELRQLDPRDSERKAQEVLVGYIESVGRAYARRHVVEESFMREFKMLSPEPTERENARILQHLRRLIGRMPRESDFALDVMFRVEPSVVPLFRKVDFCKGVA